MAEKSPLPAHEALMQAVAQYTSQGVEDLKEIARQRKAEILADLANAKLALTTAEEEQDRLRTELNRRPTKDELDSAERSVQEAKDQVTALEQRVTDLEAELANVRPLSPEEGVSLLRAYLGPVFAAAAEELRQ